MAAAEPTGATALSTTINVAKNIVGSGVLALAAGVASYGSSKSALGPAIFFMALLCGLSGYSFSLLARVGSAVGADSYRDVWAKIFGEKSAIVPAFAVVFKCGVGALAYSIIVGDSFASISKLMGGSALLTNSNVLTVAASILIFLPLCLMRNLSSLAFGSILGTAGTVYTAAFMVLRAIDGSYRAGGAYHGLLEPHLTPRFAPLAKGTPLLNLNVFVLISMLATTFLAHYNAPKFFAELAPPAGGGSKVGRFNLVCAGAFGLSMLLCSAIMSAGFLTFGGASQGLILNNYATADGLAFVARLGISASIIFSYPLIFVGLRDGTLDILGLAKHKERDDVHILSTVALLALVTSLSLVVKDLGLVVAFGGAILGSALVYVFPALMYLCSPAAKVQPRTLGHRAEVAFNVLIALLGTALAGIGGTITLKKAGVI